MTVILRFSDGCIHVENLGEGIQITYIHTLVACISWESICEEGKLALLHS